MFSWDSRNLRVPHVSSPSSPQVCLGCAELSPEFRCSRCRVARFCSKAEGRVSRSRDDRNGWCSLNWWSNRFWGIPNFGEATDFWGPPILRHFKYSWLIKVEKTRFLLVPHHVGLPAACGKATSAFLFEGSGLGLSVPKAMGNEAIQQRIRKRTGEGMEQKEERKEKHGQRKPFWKERPRKSLLFICIEWLDQLTYQWHPVTVYQASDPLSTSPKMDVLWGSHKEMTVLNMGEERWFKGLMCAKFLWVYEFILYSIVVFLSSKVAWSHHRVSTGCVQTLCAYLYGHELILYTYIPIHRHPHPTLAILSRAYFEKKILQKVLNYIYIYALSQFESDSCLLCPWFA